MIAEKKAKHSSAMPVALNCGWLKFDTKPAKQALSTWVTKWMFAHAARTTTSSAPAALRASGRRAGGARRGRWGGAMADDELTAAIAHIHAVDEARSSTASSSRCALRWRC